MAVHIVVELVAAPASVVEHGIGLVRETACKSLERVARGIDRKASCSRCDFFHLHGAVVVAADAAAAG